MIIPDGRMGLTCLRIGVNFTDRLAAIFRQ